MQEDRFLQYLDYIGETEAPIVYHRWVSIAITGALFGRQVYFPFGHKLLYPNQYIKLIGSPGTRKGSAIGPGVALLKLAGYDGFSPARCSKEQMWVDMAKAQAEVAEDGDEFLATPIDKAAELFIVAEEFNDFIGIKNDEFLVNLTNLWDCPDRYEVSYRSLKVKLENVIVNLLGANTPSGIQSAFPVEAIGSGLFSRVLFIFSDPTGVEIPFPSPVDPLKLQHWSQYLRELKDSLHGTFVIPPTARSLCAQIYKEKAKITDPRFQYYLTRRYTHLLKLIMCISLFNGRIEATERDVIQANTVLHLAETRMPSAVGQFGRARNSANSQTIYECLSNAHTPLTITELWKRVSRDFNSHHEFTNLMGDMKEAGRVMVVQDRGKNAWIAVKDVASKWPAGLIDYSLVTREERPDADNETT